MKLLFNHESKNNAERCACVRYSRCINQIFPTVCMQYNQCLCRRCLLERRALWSQTSRLIDTHTNQRYSKVVWSYNASRNEHEGETYASQHTRLFAGEKVCDALMDNMSSNRPRQRAPYVPCKWSDYLACVRFPLVFIAIGIAWHDGQTALLCSQRVPVSRSL